MDQQPDRCEKCQRKDDTLVGLQGHWYCMKCFASGCKQVGSAVRDGINRAIDRPRFHRPDPANQ